MRFPVVRRHESAADFHAREPDAPFARAVWVASPSAAALVLGSTQDGSIVAAGADVEVVRRRSGGGAVLVEPDAQLWVDVLLPAGDPLWDDDVSRSFLWLGDAWVAALGEVGVDARRHAGPMQSNRWSKLICFAGLGPGEVVGPDGAKLVGISQRRTRAGARFQCSVSVVPWDPARIVGLLALSPADQAEAVADLTGTVGHVPVEPERLLDTFLRHLP